jgi:type III pantothenate kinase
MRKLLIDVGNTFLKVAFEEDGVIKLLDRIPTKEILKNPNLLLNFSNLKADKVGISSVVKELNPLLREAFKEALFVSSSIPLPIEIEYENKELLGSDRIANACGGLYYKDTFAVVSVGTTVVVDLVENSTFKGGVIFPSFRLMAESLSLKTSQLPMVEDFKNIFVPSRSTFGCIKSGILLSIVGGIKEVLNIYKVKKIILTGGGGILS